MSVFGKNPIIGNQAEIKDIIVGDNFFAKHFCYVSNATIGNNCNIGAGVVFANYDGKEKHYINIGNNVFIGANVTLIAPLNIGNDVYIAAGTVVTEDIPDNSFVFDRKELVIRENNKEYDFLKRR